MNSGNGWPSSSATARGIMHIHQPLKSTSMRRCNSLLRSCSMSSSANLAKSWSYSANGALVHMKLSRLTTSPITCRCEGSCRLSI
ncbi:Uncharacterised protein [Mycobacteroides abscessus subsp. abscessus]|nr:Uncharacterised protein [Mycobacteroides abscessus subsp. abscessus]